MSSSTTPRSPRRAALRRVLGWLEIVLVLAVAVFWFLELRPQGLGGPAGYALVSGTSMLPHYHTGDVVIVHRQSHYRIGDVVAYRVPKGSVGAGAEVIHRLKAGNGRTGFVVQGDNRTAPDIWHPTNREIVGREWAHIPHAGSVVRLLHTPLFLGGLAAAIALLSVLFHARRAEDEAPQPVAPVHLPQPEPEPEPRVAPSFRLMLPVEGEPPEGARLCSPGCHILLVGTRFDPHTGEPVLAPAQEPPVPVGAERGRRAEEPVAPPFWELRRDKFERFAEYELAPAYRVAPPAIDFERLEREIHEAVRSSTDVKETMRELVGAIGEYGEHLRSHTAVMRALAATTGDLQATTAEMREFLAGLTSLLRLLVEQQRGGQV